MMPSKTVPTLPTWYRVFAVVVGLVSIALALVVLADPLLAVWVLIFLLAFALLVMGLDRLVAGITGHSFGWRMMPPPVSGTGNAPTSGSGETGPPLLNR
jgi:uncharacterized membrane protein HdeD (DUF308 family)